MTQSIGSFQRPKAYSSLYKRLDGHIPFEIPVLFGTTLVAMKFKTSPTGVDFEIADDWWTFAEMELFTRGPAAFYYFGCQPDTDIAQVVDLSSVEPPMRNAGVPLFKKYKLVPVFFAFTSTECSLPPVRVVQQSGSTGYQYKIQNGLHRYYASAAVGYTGLPVVIQKN